MTTPIYTQKISANVQNPNIKSNNSIISNSNVLQNNQQGYRSIDHLDFMLQDISLHASNQRQTTNNNLPPRQNNSVEHGNFQPQPNFNQNFPQHQPQLNSSQNFKQNTNNNYSHQKQNVAQLPPPPNFITSPLQHPQLNPLPQLHPQIQPGTMELNNNQQLRQPAPHLIATQNMNVQYQNQPPLGQPTITTQQFQTPSLLQPSIQKRPAYPQNPQQQVQPQVIPQIQPQLQQPQKQNVMNGLPNVPQYQSQPTQLSQGGGGLSITQSGFSTLWGQETIDLMQTRHILPTHAVKPAPISLNNQFNDSLNCDPDIFRGTVSKIPESNSLLQKSRLPLGVLIHPFRDLANLPVVSCSQIVRCRACRTYINPFVYFVDSKKWKCNLCYRVNELPDEFQYDPVSKSFGDVTRRPEVRSSTIEYIAPSEYMLRPPQPAVYLFLLDVSMLAIQSGYLSLVCDALAEHLDKLPGDARTQVGFITFNSAVHFYSIADGYNRPQEITILDIDDIFLPRPDNLLVNLKEGREMINNLLDTLPKRFENSHDSGSALGAALQVALKMMGSTGGRVSIFQTCLPNKGPGALLAREDPNNRSAKDVNHLGPATDFYKKLALEYSGQQISADIFLLNCQYSDLSTLAGISKFSGGCIFHFPLFNSNKKQDCIMFRKCFERYLTRKIGFEAVMRVRCTRGLSIHTFHGNFFVRSTDLLSLPNVNPDAGFGMQISYEENLTDVRTVCFQAALLYTSSKAERRIRVHTLCLPVTNSLTEVIYSADVECIIGLLSKMAVDRSLQSNLSDARDAFINATVDVFAAFKIAQNLPPGSGQLTAPKNLSLLPLYILALLKHTAFRTGTSTRLDDRIFAMCELKTLPLDQLMRYIYPDFYHLECLFTGNNEDTSEIHQLSIPPRHQLSAEFLSSQSLYIIDNGPKLFVYVGSNVSPQILKSVFGVSSINEIPDICFELAEIKTSDNERLHAFINQLNEDKPFTAFIQIIRDSSTWKNLFIEKLIDDRTEGSLSYYEFLQHLRTQIK